MLTAVESPVRISVSGCAPDAVAGRWRVTWVVTNVVDEALRLQEAWLPHGHFRGEGHIALAFGLAAGAEDVLELNVRAEEPPGTVVRNAFLILQVRGERQ